MYNVIRANLSLRTSLWTLHQHRSCVTCSFTRLFASVKTFSDMDNSWGYGDGAGASNGGYNGRQRYGFGSQHERDNRARGDRDETRYGGRGRNDDSWDDRRQWGGRGGGMGGGDDCVTMQVARMYVGRIIGEY